MITKLVNYFKLFSSEVLYTEYVRYRELDSVSFVFRNLVTLCRLNK